MENPRKPSVSMSVPATRAGQTAHPQRTYGRGHGRATQADVAELAGVTTMTVSRFMRSPSHVGSVTAEKIREAVETTRYILNKNAGLLAGGRSSIVAVIVPSIASSAFSSTVQALGDGLQRHGLELLLAATNYELQREEQQIRSLLAWSPSALVVTGHKHTRAANDLLRRAQASGIPVVVMWDHDGARKEFVQIGFDHSLVGSMMASHLLDRGHRDLLYVSNGDPRDVRSEKRCQAFVCKAQDSGAKVRVVSLPYDMDAMAAGREVMRVQLLDGLPRAMAFSSDFPAAGAFLQAQRSAIAVPDQLAMMGFGDYPIATQVGAGLSTIGVDRLALGALCAQQVISMVAGDSSREVHPNDRQIVPKIFQRETT